MFFIKENQKQINELFGGNENFDAFTRIFFVLEHKCSQIFMHEHNDTEQSFK